MAPAFQVTRGRMAAKQAHALRAGARVSATLVALTGPKSHVTGAIATPTSVPEVFESRLAPRGTLTAPEKKRLCRWAMAQAGQAMNQTSCAGSPHPHVSVAEGWPDQTCHHKTMAGSVKQARARRWTPTVRNARRVAPGPACGSDSCSAVPGVSGAVPLWPGSAGGGGAPG